jgi:riboflavin biosynthesis pyrimidine reductase
VSLSGEDPARRPLRLSRLLPPGEPATVMEALAQDGLWERGERAGERPHTMLNMVSTVDGRATLAGHPAQISGEADIELFHGLRTVADAVLVGAATARMESYGRMLREQARRKLRARRGLPDEPLACLVSGRLELPPDLPLLAEPQARVVVLTPSQASLPATAAQVEYVRCERDGALDLRAALRELRERFSVRSLLCEGGPHLAGELLAGGLLDELFLSLTPKLLGGEQATGESLRILAGLELQPPSELVLRGALEHDSSLFLRYDVRASAGESVSLETI